MAKNTFATRNFEIGDARVEKGTDLVNLPADQLRDFQQVGLAGPKPDEATPAAPAGKA